MDDTTQDGLTVREVLKSKHPLAQRTHDEALLTGVQPRPHSVIFGKLDGLTVRAAVLQSQGGAGPSGMDASNWRRLCTMFHGPSKKLCTSIAAMARPRRLCTEHVDLQVIQPLIACRLIPLSKNTGVRPIEVCEALRRLLGKAILRVVGLYVREVTGLTQLCAGQKSGC